MAGWFRSILRGSAGSWGIRAVGVVLLVLAAGKLGRCAGEWAASWDEREFDAKRVQAAVREAEAVRQLYWTQRDRSDSLEMVNGQLAELARAASVVADTAEHKAQRGKAKLVVDSTLADSVQTLLGVVADQDAALYAKDVRIRSDSLRIIILTVDRDAWHETADSAVVALDSFQVRTRRELQKRDCSLDPFGAVSCPSRKTSFAVGTAVGAGAVVALRTLFTSLAKKA